MIYLFEQANTSIKVGQSIHEVSPDVETKIKQALQFIPESQANEFMD